MNYLICLLDNGLARQRERSIRSIEKQTDRDFLFRTLDFPEFWTNKRNEFSFGADYVLYLYSGSELAPDAVETLKKAVARTPALWYYFDEERKDSRVEEAFYSLEKPDFGALSFAGTLFTGEGVLFSEAALKKMSLIYDGSNFAVSILEMTIAAAMQAEGVHIPCKLLSHFSRGLLTTEERELLSASARSFLIQNKYDPDCFQKNENTPGFTLRPKHGNHKISLILPDGGNAVGSAETEIITVPGGGSYMEKCLRGAQNAQGDILCFVAGDCGLPTGEDLQYMADYAALPFVGTVSPRLCNADEVLYGGLFTYAGIPLRFPNSDNVQETREIALPARQCWMVKRELLAYPEISALAEEEGLCREYLLMELSSRLNAHRLHSLYLGSVSVRCASPEHETVMTGFTKMLLRHKEKLIQDPTCPVTAKAWLRKKQMNGVAAYFPEEMPDFDSGKKRVFVLTHELSQTGAPIVLSHAVNILKSAGWQVVVASPKDGVLKKEFLRLGIPVLILGDMDKNAQWLQIAGDFDLVIVNTIVPFRQIEQLRELPVPVLWWLHDARSGYNSYLKQVLPTTVGSNVHIYSVSKYADDAFKSCRPDFETKLLMYGLQDEAAAVETMDDPLAGQNAEYVFITAGSIILRKGQDVLAEAIRQLPDDIRRRCLFLFAGKKTDAEIYRHMEELQEDYPEQVRIIESIPHDDIIAYFRSAKAVICCSRDDPLPTFMAETMMVSGVCICSENTGTAALIRDGENGYVYHNNDPRELADCILRCIANPDEQRMKQQGRVTFETEFSMEVFRRNLLRCVEECLGNTEEKA